MKKVRFKKFVKHAAKTITEDVLGRFYANPLGFSEDMRRLSGMPINQKLLTKKELYNTVERIRRQGWLEKKVTEDQIFYRLTAKGRIKYLSFKLQTAPKQRGEQATILIFDIPEEKRTYRSFLRGLLKNMKFIMIQKSVWIAPYILPKEFYDLMKEMNLLEFVKVIEGCLRF